MVAITVAGMVFLIAGPYIYRLWKREKLRLAVRQVYTIVVASRLHAVRYNQQVVLWIDLRSRRIMTWADAPPFDFVRGPGERFIQNVPVPAAAFFRYAPSGAQVDDADAICFDTYAGDPELVDRIVFRGDGTIVPPQAANSVPPIRPHSYTTTVPYGSVDCSPTGRCRGIYLSDSAAGGASANRNTFRVNVDDFGQAGRVTLLKWIPPSEGGNRGEINYVPPPWSWVD